jgi:hypothetical protein
LRRPKPTRVVVPTEEEEEELHLALVEQNIRWTPTVKQHRKLKHLDYE